MPTIISEIEVIQDTTSIPLVEPIKTDLYVSFNEDVLDYNYNNSAFANEDVLINGILNENILNDLNNRLQKFEQLQPNWNGNNTWPPSKESIKNANYIFNLYLEYLNNNLEFPASIQIVPLNCGGIGIELSTDIASLELDILNSEAFKSVPQIFFLLTDDEKFEEESIITIGGLSGLFNQLHTIE